MMVRLIVQRVACCPSGEVVRKSYQTFDIELPTLEALLTPQPEPGYVDYSLVGAEVITPDGNGSD